MAPRWRELVRIYRRLEFKGEIRGGRFVSGFVGEQFALPEAVTALRDVHRAPATDALEVVAACDPLNLVGIVTPGERVPSQPGNRIVFRDGVPVVSLEKGAVVNRSHCDTDTMSAARNLLYGPIGNSGIEPHHPEEAYRSSIRQTRSIPDQAAPEPALAAGLHIN